MASQGRNPLETLRSVEVASLQQAAGLQVIGLKWPLRSDLDYVTLGEALQQETLDVTEIGEEGQVPIVKIVNNSNHMVFLMAGELLVGCKQDRVLNTSMMVPAKSEMPIPVTCVEAGRWGYRSRKFYGGRSSSHSYLRMMISKQSSAAYQDLGVPKSDQAAVWAEVKRKLLKMGSSSATGALNDLFQDYGQKLKEALDNLSAPPDCNGAAFAIDGMIVGADLFDKPKTLSTLWPKLISGYAMDALENDTNKSPMVEPASVTAWVKSACSAKQEPFDSPGLGQDLRITGERLVGAALLVEERPVHLQLFSEVEGDSGQQEEGNR